MEDIRLGRELSAGAKFVTVATAARTAICGPDPRRTRLTISTDGSGLVYFGPTDAQPDTAKGLCLTATNPTITLRVEEWGKLVQAAWFGQARAADAPCLIVESTLERQ